MANKLPYMPFYTGDWLKDPALSLCTPATRGVWMDLLAAMHEAGRSGQLRGTTEQLARVARCSTADIAQALTDLQATGAADVLNRDGIVTVSNRRMRRDAELREKAAVRQRSFRRRSSNGMDVTDESRDSHAIVTLSEGDSEDASGNSDVVRIPEVLNTKEFLEIWEKWIKRRRKKKWSVDTECLQSQLDELALAGVDGAIACIKESIKNGWQGVFPKDRYAQSIGKHGPGQVYDPNAPAKPGVGTL